MPRRGVAAYGGRGRTGRHGGRQHGAGRPDGAGEARLTPLVATYLEKREALLRYFAARLGSPAAAEDVVQEIYLKLAAMPADAPVQNNAAFLYRMGANVMLDRLRQQRRASVRDADWRESQVTLVAGQEVTDEPAADETVISRERLKLMLEVIEALPPQAQRAFRLHKLEGLSQAETAEALGVSRSSVEKYISAALKRLLARLR